MCSKKGVVNVLNDCSKQTGPSASRGNDISRLPFLQKPFLQKRGPLSIGNLFLVKGKRPPSVGDDIDNFNDDDVDDGDDDDDVRHDGTS